MGTALIAQVRSMNILMMTANVSFVVPLATDLVPTVLVVSIGTAMGRINVYGVALRLLGAARIVRVRCTRSSLLN
jgi:hypothetical protein